MTARVRLCYFAQSRELTGLKEEVVTVTTPISSFDLWTLLLRQHTRLSVLQGHVILAVRQQYVAIGDQVVSLRDGDEVAEVVDAVTLPSCGATSVFIGTTREDEVDGRKVIGLEYEAYESMVQSEFSKMCSDIRAVCPSVANICIHHRLGWVKVGEASIVMAISSPHRKESEQAIQLSVSLLKANVPIWKKEVYHTQEESWKENAECKWSELGRQSITETAENPLTE